MANLYNFPTELNFPSNVPALLDKVEDLVYGFEEATEVTDLGAPASQPIPSATSAINYVNCPICQNIARDPVELSCCHHWFCMLCFLKFFKQSPLDLKCEHTAAHPDRHRAHINIQCTYCKGTFEFHNVREIGRLPHHRRDAYYGVKVKCPNECGYSGFLYQISAHQYYRCRKRVVRCPNYECPIAKNEMVPMRHHFKSCPHKRCHCFR